MLDAHANIRVKVMDKWKEYFCVVLCGALGYSTLEICWRGYTHWTMALTGGVGLLCVYIMSGLLEGCGFLQKCLIGCLLLTTLELSVGALVNLRMGWRVWDYSSQPGNLLGQICPLYSIFWFFLCMLLIPLCTWLRCALRRPPSKSFSPIEVE